MAKPHARFCSSGCLDGRTPFKVKEEGLFVSKAVHCVIGVNRDGLKDIMGMYLGRSEGASFWLGVLFDIHLRMIWT
jgi:transposase-like protein